MSFTDNIPEIAAKIPLGPTTDIVRFMYEDALPWEQAVQKQIDRDMDLLTQDLGPANLDDYTDILNAYGVNEEEAAGLGVDFSTLPELPLDSGEAAWKAAYQIKALADTTDAFLTQGQDPIQAQQMAEDMVFNPNRPSPIGGQNLSRPVVETLAAFYPGLEDIGNPNSEYAEELLSTADKITAASGNEFQNLADYAHDTWLDSRAYVEPLSDAIRNAGKHVENRVSENLPDDPWGLGGLWTPASTFDPSTDPFIGTEPGPEGVYEYKEPVSWEVDEQDLYTPEWKSLIERGLDAASDAISTVGASTGIGRSDAQVSELRDIYESEGLDAFIRFVSDEANYAGEDPVLMMGDVERFVETIDNVSVRNAMDLVLGDVKTSQEQATKRPTPATEAPMTTPVQTSTGAEPPVLSYGELDPDRQKFYEETFGPYGGYWGKKDPETGIRKWNPLGPQSGPPPMLHDYDPTTETVTGEGEMLIDDEGNWILKPIVRKFTKTDTGEKKDPLRTGTGTRGGIDTRVPSTLPFGLSDALERVSYSDQFRRLYNQLEGSAGYEAQQNMGRIFGDSELLYYLQEPLSARTSDTWVDPFMNIAGTAGSQDLASALVGGESRLENQYYSDWLGSEGGFLQAPEAYYDQLAGNAEDLRRRMWEYEGISMAGEGGLMDRWANAADDNARALIQDDIQDRLVFMDPTNSQSTNRLARLVALYNTPRGSDSWYQSKMQNFFTNMYDSWRSEGNSPEDFLRVFVGGGALGDKRTYVYDPEPPPPYIE